VQLLGDLFFLPSKSPPISTTTTTHHNHYQYRRYVHQRLKESAAEVLKGNQIIEKLQSDLRLSRDKLKRKQAILVRQEEEVAAREAALTAAQREVHQLQVWGLGCDWGGVGVGWGWRAWSFGVGGRVIFFG